MTVRRDSGDSVEMVDRRSLRFTNIELANWRNFKAVRAELQTRMFLVGPNASGKSNFLDAFRFLAAMVSVGGGFQAAVKDRGGVSALRSLAARRYPRVGITVALGNDRSPDEWEYELKFGQDNQSRAVITSEVVRHRGVELLERPNEEDRADPERLRQTYLEQVNVNREFRDVADFFASLRYMHIVPQLVREPERSVNHPNDPFGGDFLVQIARTNKRTRDSRLRVILEALKIAVPQLELLELKPDERGIPHLRGKYQHWRPHGAWQNEDQFSDGTLRLLGLLWAISDGSGPLLLEEPELSLHPEVIRAIPQIFARVQRRSGRQILVSSHSTEILNDSGVAPDEVLALLPGKEGTTVQMVKNDPSVMSMHSAGIGLGEILRGLTAPEGAARLGLFGG